jgi:hypothetical protein
VLSIHHDTVVLTTDCILDGMTLLSLINVYYKRSDEDVNFFE